jgi:pentatricopeptide repeat protein
MPACARATSRARARLWASCAPRGCSLTCALALAPRPRPDPRPCPRPRARPSLPRPSPSLTLALAPHAPQVRTYSIMIHVCARGARADEAFEWLERMEEAGIAPNAVTLSALINACGRAGQLTGPRGAFRVLADMQRAGLTPNVITYTTLLDACAKACELRWLGLGLANPNPNPNPKPRRAS